MQTHEIKYKNKNLVYHTSGEGHPVVLLHGFGEDGSVWDPIIPELTSYKLIIPELPGTGPSAITEDMSIEGLAESVMFTIENEAAREGIPPGSWKVIMIGHSMGGYITLAFAEKYRDRLSGLGLFHSSAYADSDEKKETRRKGIEFIRKNGAFEFLKTAIPNLYAPETREKRPELVEKQINASRNFSDAALVSYYESMMKRPDRTHILKTIKMPVLFILGKYDMAVPLKDGLEQCILPELLYIHVLEHSGHMGMYEETNEAANNILTYLNSTTDTR